MRPNSSKELKKIYLRDPVKHLLPKNGELLRR